MNSPGTESKPLRERLIPQASIRTFLWLIGASAVVMYVYRAAIVGDAFWAKIASLLITVAGGCFLAYACCFLIANLFSATTTPLLNIPPPNRATDAARDGFDGGPPTVGEA